MNKGEPRWNEVKAGREIVVGQKMAMKCFNHKNTRKERNIHNFLELFALGVKGKNNGFGVMLCHYYLQNWILQHTTILSYKSFMSQLDFKDFLPCCSLRLFKNKTFILMRCWHMTRAFITKKKHCLKWKAKNLSGFFLIPQILLILNEVFLKTSSSSLNLLFLKNGDAMILGFFSWFLWGIFIIYYFLFYRYARWFSNFTQRHRCFCWKRHNIKMFPAKRTSKSRSSVEKRWRFLGSNLF